MTRGTLIDLADGDLLSLGRTRRNRITGTSVGRSQSSARSRRLKRERDEDIARYEHSLRFDDWADREVKREDRANGRPAPRQCRTPSEQFVGGAWESLRRQCDQIALDPSDAERATEAWRASLADRWWIFKVRPAAFRYHPMSPPPPDWRKGLADYCERHGLSAAAEDYGMSEASVQRHMDEARRLWGVA